MTNQQLIDKKVLITGAGGFIASNLIRRLIDRNCNVIALLHPLENPWRIKDKFDSIEIIYGDITEINQDEYTKKLEGIDTIFHLAAAGVDSRDKNGFNMISTNIIGTYNLLLLAKNLQISKFVYCGSCFEYGIGSLISENAPLHPNSEYAATKSAGWLLTNTFFHKYQLPTVSVRPFTPFGPYEANFRLVSYTILQSLAGLEIKLTKGEQTRDFIFIEDLVEGFIQSALLGTPGKTYNLCSGNEISVKEIVEKINRLTGKKSNLIFGAIPYRENELWQLSGNPELAYKELNWKTNTTIDSGLEKTISWFSQNRSLYY